MKWGDSTCERLQFGSTCHRGNSGLPSPGLQRAVYLAGQVSRQKLGQKHRLPDRARLPMSVDSNSWLPVRPLASWVRLALFAIGLGLAARTYSQTASTGAVIGVTLDPSGAILPAVVVHLSKPGGGEKKSVTSDENGRFGFLLLPPGKYELQASAPDFESLILPEINVIVTETVRLELNLRLETLLERAQVSSNPLLVQPDSSALGRVVNENAVSGLPLVTRNFAQIPSLSPGISTGANNAEELVLGGTALSQIAKSNDGSYTHAARSYDNDFQLDGISVEDGQGSAAVRW